MDTVRELVLLWVPKGDSDKEPQGNGYGLQKRVSLLKRFRNGKLDLGFLSQYGLKKLPSLATTGLDFCSLWSSVINSRSLTADRDELSVSRIL